MIKGRGVTVQFTRGKRTPPDTAFVSGQYASKAGDPRRQGRADAGDRRQGQDAVSIEFKECSSHVEARIGVVVVGAVTPDPTSGGYLWSVDLAGMSRMPRPALTMEKARNAIAHKVREWCEAARLITARRAKP